MTAVIDLDGYFQRIGYTGERRARLNTLRAIHVRHPEAIAFENLNSLLKCPVRLDAPSLQQKLVRAGRGGYCFEQNLLLSHVTNWYLSNHPNSHFVNGLIAARAAPDRRYALSNNELAVHHLNGSTERRVLATASELRTALEGTFGLTLPEAPELDAALVRLTTQSG